MSLHTRYSIRDHINDDVYASTDLSVVMPKYRIPRNEHSPEHAFGHGGTTDVAHADKQNLHHRLRLCLILQKQKLELTVIFQIIIMYTYFTYINIIFIFIITSSEIS